MNNFSDKVRSEDLSYSTKSLFITRWIFMLFSVVLIAGGSFFFLLDLYNGIGSENLNMSKPIATGIIVTVSVVVAILIGVGELYSASAVVAAYNHQNRLTHLFYFLISIFLSYFFVYELVSHTYIQEPRSKTNIKSVENVKTDVQLTLEKQVLRFDEKLKRDEKELQRMLIKNYARAHTSNQKAIIEVTSDRLRQKEDELNQYLLLDIEKNDAKKLNIEKNIKNENKDKKNDAKWVARGLAFVMLLLAFIYGVMRRTRYEPVRFKTIDTEFEKIESENIIQFEPNQIEVDNNEYDPKSEVYNILIDLADDGNIPSRDNVVDEIKKRGLDMNSKKLAPIYARLVHDGLIERRKDNGYKIA